MSAIEIVGGAILLAASVVIIVLGQRLSPHRVFAFVNLLGHRVVKHWRWR